MLQLVSRRIVEREGDESFVGYARNLCIRFPLELQGEPSLRIRAGAICLNDPNEAQACLAVFRVARQSDVSAGLLEIPARNADRSHFAL
jgi:hypothetical protein